MELNYFWWIEAIVGIGVLVGVQYGIKKIISHMKQKGSKSWHLRFARLVQPPLTALIWILGIFYLIDLIGFEIAAKYLSALRKSTVVGCSVWLFFRWKREFEHSFLTRPSNKIDSTSVRIIGRLVTIAISILTGLILLQIFGIGTAPLLAFGSIGAASIGFAGKDIIANFCSGIMLHITRPFIEGNLIFLPEKNLEGHIEEIGWFRTSIRDKDKRAVYLPNNLFSTQLVVNISRMTHRHFKQIVKIPLNEVEKIPAVVAKIKSTIQQIPEIDTKLPIHVFLKSFGDYACEVEIETYSIIVDQAVFNQFQQELLLKIEADLSSMGVPMALPTMSWSLSTD